MILLLVYKLGACACNCPPCVYIYDHSGTLLQCKIYWSKWINTDFPLQTIILNRTTDPAHMFTVAFYLSVRPIPCAKKQKLWLQILNKSTPTLSFTMGTLFIDETVDVFVFWGDVVRACLLPLLHIYWLFLQLSLSSSCPPHCVKFPFILLMSSKTVWSHAFSCTRSQKWRHYKRNLKCCNWEPRAIIYLATLYVSGNNGDAPPLKRSDEFN